TLTAGAHESFRGQRYIVRGTCCWYVKSRSLALLVWCCRAPCGGYCESAGVEGRRFASAMVDGRTSREFSHPTTNVDEESSGRWLQSADRRFGYKLTSVGVHPGSAYLTTEERSCQAQWILESMWPKTPCRLLPLSRRRNRA